MMLNKKAIALLVIALALSSGIGYGVGFSMGARYTMIYALNLADEFIIDIDFDEEAIAAGLFSYRNQVNNCFDNPMTNLTT